MHDEPISLEPQIVQFSSQQKQLLKITNRTGETIPNCFFCLFNTSKYEFSPQSFRLEPWQHKIVTVTLVNNKSDYKPKQFAYIKSKNFSKRITFVYGSDGGLGQGDDDRMMRSPSSGVDDLHTLSSRDYRETQKAAYDRVIAEKEAYIKRLERRLEEHEESNRKDRSFTSQTKPKNAYNREIQFLEQKIQQTIQQKQAAFSETMHCKQKIKQLETLLIRGSSSSAAKTEQMDQIQKIIKRKDQTITKMKQQINFLQIQCQSLYVTISQKEEKIRKYEQRNNQMVNQLIRDNELRLKELQIKIEQERKKSEREHKSYREKVKKLQEKLTESQVRENRYSQLENQIENKEKQLTKLQTRLQEQKRRRKQHQEEKKKSYKAQLQNESLLQQNTILKSKVQNLQKSVEDLRQQTIIYRSKVTEQGPDKASRYLQVALESCRNENEILKKSRKQMELSLGEETKSRRMYEGRVKELQGQIRDMQEEISRVKAERDELENKNRISRNESHEAIMKLRSQNIDLIEKMSIGHSRVDSNVEKEILQSRLKLEKSQEQIRKIRKESDQEIKKIKNEYDNVFNRLKEVEDDKMKMSRKMQKYKKQTRKELEDITQNTLDELKKVKQQKKKLQQKVSQMQKTQLQKQKQKQKMQTNTKLDLNDSKPRYPACQSDRRYTGIKNQRKEIEQTFNSYSRNQEMESLYSQLGELREFRNYVGMEMRKIRDVLGIREEMCTGGEGTGQSLIFNCVTVFDKLRAKLSEQISDREKVYEAEKELSFLRGRITEIEAMKGINRNSQLTEDKLSAIEPSKNQDRRLLELVREEMRNQYKKLNDTLAISQEKYEILKRKIYEEYRSRIIGILTTKEKIDNIGRINKIQAVLQRFVQGLANKSHKQAVLSKEVRLKYEARREAGTLKQKVGVLNQLLQNKRGYCSRDTVKVFPCINEPQWHDNLRLEARLLTYQAQNARLLEEINFFQSQTRDLEEQSKIYLDQLQLKQSEITKLKKQVIEIESANAKQLLRRQQDIEQLQRKFTKMQEEGYIGCSDRANQEKQLALMRQDIERKKDIIKGLKQKEKLLEQLVESNRSSDTSNRNKVKKETFEEMRVQESLREFRENNRELRVENSKLKQEILSLKQEIAKKNAIIKRSKGQQQQSRIRAVRHDGEQLDKLKVQIRNLKDELKSATSELDKIRKKKQKQILQLESQLKRVKNEFTIEKRSLQSIIRALCDSIKRLYADLDIIARKKGLARAKQVNFQQLIDNPGEIDSLKVYEAFEQLLQALK